MDWWSNVITKGFSYGSFYGDMSTLPTYGDYNSTVSLTCPEDGYAVMNASAKGHGSYAYSYVYLNGHTMAGNRMNSVNGNIKESSSSGLWQGYVKKGDVLSAWAQVSSGAISATLNFYHLRK